MSAKLQHDRLSNVVKKLITKYDKCVKIQQNSNTTVFQTAILQISGQDILADFYV